MLFTFLGLTVCLGGRFLLAVHDSPETPTFSLFPVYNIYIPGDSVTLSCEAPHISQFRMYRYIFLKDGSEITGTRTDTNSYLYTYEYRISITDVKKDPSFSCQYWELGQTTGPFSSRSVSVSVTGHPEAPTISISPQYKFYVSGDSVTLRCEAPSARGYRFFKNRNEITGKQDTSSTDYKVIIRDEEKSVSYSCQYWIQESGREISSPQSSSVSLSMTGHPEAPTVSLSPQYKLYVFGESVTVNCAAPHDVAPTKYQFWKTGGQILEIQNTSSYQYTVTPTDEKNKTYLYCIYQIQKLGREIRSSWGDIVGFSVTDPLSPPTLSLHPHEVTDGDVITMNCTAPKNYKNVIVYFHKGEQVLHSETPEAPGRGISFSFRAGQKNLSDDGNYFCSYEVEIQGRRMKSPESLSIQVSLKGSSSSWVWIGSRAGLGLIFLMLMALLLYWILVMKKSMALPFPHFWKAEYRICHPSKIHPLLVFYHHRSFSTPNYIKGSRILYLIYRHLRQAILAVITNPM